MKASQGDIPAYLVEGKRILDQRFREPLVIEDVAAQVGVSFCHLCHAFSTHYQISPYACLTRLRMEEACRLLVQTHLYIDQIAREVGYASSSRFCANFRRNVGMTPGQYRRSGGK